MKKNYLSPSVYVEEVKVEKGFATSTGSQVPEQDGTFSIDDFEDAGDAW